MKTCENCGKEFPTFMEIEGKVRNLQRRRYCIDCSPFNQHNTVPLVRVPKQHENCVICGQILTGKQEKYCSDECKVKMHSSYENQKSKGIERRLRLVSLAGGCCSTCGYNKNLAALTFHHIDSSIKKFQLDARNVSNLGWKPIMEEFEKCILLCANCHAEEHYPELLMETLLEEYSKDVNDRKWVY